MLMPLRLPYRPGQRSLGFFLMRLVVRVELLEMMELDKLRGLSNLFHRVKPKLPERCRLDQKIGIQASIVGARHTH
jgi:hypothetical protein